MKIAFASLLFVTGFAAPARADVRNHWEYPAELGGVWKFQAA